jgi:WD40-like Beta Propeller Repeat
MALGRIGRIAWIASVLAAADACSSKSSSSTRPEPCNPGEVVACRTPEGCSGEKICKADGQGYDACACGTSGNGGAAGAGSGGSKGSGGAQGGSASGDAGQAGDNGVGGEAGGSTGPCDLSAPFGDGTLVPGIGGLDSQGAPSEEVDAALSANQLTIYFASNRNGDWDLFSATRTDPGGTFDLVEPLNSFNSNANEGAPTVTTDETTIYFASEEGGWQIYSSSRMSSAGSFGTGLPVSDVNTTYADYNPFILPNESAIYLASDRAGGPAKIYRAGFAGANFGDPVAVQNINLDTATDSRPVLTPDELIIYFSSTRPDDNAEGLEDIWTASRSSSSEPFGPPARVAELSSSTLDEPSWISPDGCTLYYHSAVFGSRQVYVARKP